MPYPVYEAFLQYKVKLKVLGGGVELTMPMTAVEKEVSRQKHSFGAEPMVQLELTETEKQPVKAAAANLRQISQPQQIDVRVESSKLKTKLDFLATPVEVGLSPTDRTEIYNKTPLAYLANVNKEERPVTGEYDKAANMYRFKTMDLGSYGLYSAVNALIGQPVLTPAPHWSEAYRSKVMAHMALKNLGAYNPNQAIRGQAFYNGIYSGVSQSNEIDFNGDIAGDKKRTLVNSGLMPSSANLDGTVSRMDAFTAFVKSYEMIQDVRLPYDKNRVAAVAGAQGISREQAITLLKAENAGLLSNIAQAAPRRTISYGEYFTLFSKTKGW